MSNIPKISQTSKNLRWAILMSLVVLILEIVGGIKAGSLALLSDAGHVFGDVFSLIITFVALKIAFLPPNTRRTFGYHRAEVFAALINGLALLGLAGWIGFEAYQRFLNPPEVRGWLVVIVAFLGLLPNLWTTWKLRRETNLNIKSAFLHAASDTVSSLAVILAGLAITFTGLNFLDPLASAIIVVLIILSALRLLRNSLVILLEGVPPHFKLEEISKKLGEIEGMLGFHDLHLWTICSDVIYLTGHLVISQEDLCSNQWRQITKNAAKLLESRGIHHTTFQFETPETACEKCVGCEILH